MVADKIGYLFPGQGAQYVGMGKEWAERFDAARTIYEKADAILGFGIKKICFDGPEEVLTRTLYAQPAIFTTSLALLTVLQNEYAELKPDWVAGLSLGEFTALVATGSIAFEDGLRLVHLRAQLMEKAAQETNGTMISIIGLNQSDCKAIAKETGLDLANLNAPDQFVLSGQEVLMDRATQLAGAKGAKKVIRLKVGGAFHSRLMASAKRDLQETLKKVSVKPPRSIFVANASAMAETKPETIRNLLGEQLVSPVRWIETIQQARLSGIRRLVEFGPGRVLKGLVRRIDRSLEVLSLEKISDLEALKGLCC